MGLAGAPAAVGTVPQEFFLDVGARQRLVPAAADMRLPFFQHRAVFQANANMPGVLIGIAVVRIDLVAHLGRQALQARVGDALVGEGVEAGVAEHEAGGDAVGLAELGGVGVGRALLRSERLPEPVQRSFRGFADDLFDLFNPDLF